MIYLPKCYPAKNNAENAFHDMKHSLIRYTYINESNLLMFRGKKQVYSLLTNSIFQITI